MKRSKETWIISKVKYYWAFCSKATQGLSAILKNVYPAHEQQRFHDAFDVISLSQSAVFPPCRTSPIKRTPINTCMYCIRSCTCKYCSYTGTRNKLLLHLQYSVSELYHHENNLHLSFFLDSCREFCELLTCLFLPSQKHHTDFLSKWQQHLRRECCTINWY